MNEKKCKLNVYNNNNDFRIRFTNIETKETYTMHTHTQSESHLKLVTIAV